MRTAPVVVRDPLAKDSSEMAFVERDQFCERLIGTIRRECLGWLPFVRFDQSRHSIPLS